MFTLPALPYSLTALEPYMSSRQLKLHYGTHHKGYVDKLNLELRQNPLHYTNLIDIIQWGAGTQHPLFNYAAQHFNHSFFWESMRPAISQIPASGELELAVNDSFGNVSFMIAALIAKAEKNFGSGWIWLALNKEKKLYITVTHDADNPIAHNERPILCCDLWEHSYYLDYEADRTAYVTNVITKLANWNFASKNYDKRHEPL